MVATRVFKSGNSVALRLPKALGIKEGTRMSVREEQGRYIVEPIEDASDKIDLTGIWGSMPDLKPLAHDDRLMEPRELDWDGKLAQRG